jgi:4,5-dihydroxyphthalate decarboxylase
MPCQRLDIVIRGGEHEHTRDLAGDYGSVRLGYERMRLQDTFDAMMARRPFEVCEFSLANYIVLRAAGEDWLSAIPVFPFRAFRHSLALVRRDSALRGPGDLAGKRVGVEDYSMTAAVWYRALLRSEFGVDWRAITWVTYEKQRFPLPRSAPVDTTTRDLEDLLCEGGIDALLGFAVRDSSLPAIERRLRPLLADSGEVESEYFRRTGIYPINHCMVIRSDVLAAHPFLAGVVCTAYEGAKERALRRQPGVGLPQWAAERPDQARALFGADPLPYGLTPANRTIVRELSRALEDQGFVAKAPPVDALFVDAAHDLAATPTPP